MRGPMSLADFMKHALAHPAFGYYIKEHPVFGARGDFITSPEISQMFGELVAVWLVSTWQRLGSPPCAIIECGPGRGTLITGVLRAAKRFPTFRAALRAVHLVETSPALRNVQAEALQVASFAPPDAADVAIRGTGTAGAAHPTSPAASAASASGNASGIVSDRGHLPGLPVSWHDRLADVPTTPADASAAAAGTAASPAAAPAAEFLIAHEFFDALPVHQFVCTQANTKWSVPDAAASADASAAASGAPVISSTVEYTWRERLVDVAPAAAPAVASSVSSQPLVTGASTPAAPAGGSGVSGSGPAFRMVLAPSATPMSMVYTPWLADHLQRDSQAARAAAPVEGTAPGNATASAAAQSSGAPAYTVGDVSEFSPASCEAIVGMGKRLVAARGAALVVDYGYSRYLQEAAAAGSGDAAATAAAAAAAPAAAPAPSSDRWRLATVRGIRAHAFVDMLDSPGDVDLSADVDFDALRWAVEDAGLMAGTGAPVPSSPPAGQLQAAAPSVQHPLTITGPVPQGQWLMELGLGLRLQKLCDAAKGAPLAAPRALPAAMARTRAMAPLPRVVH